MSADTDILLKGEIIYGKSCSCGIKQDQVFLKNFNQRAQKKLMIF